MKGIEKNFDRSLLKESDTFSMNPNVSIVKLVFQEGFYETRENFGLTNCLFAEYYHGPWHNTEISYN